MALCLVGACLRALSLYLLAKLALSVLSPVVSGVLYNMCILHFVEELATKQVVTRNQTMIIQQNLSAVAYFKNSSLIQSTYFST